MRTRLETAHAYFRANATMYGRPDNLPQQQRAVRGFAKRNKLSIVTEHLDIVRTDWGLVSLIFDLCRPGAAKVVIVEDANTFTSGAREACIWILKARGVRVLTAAGKDLTATALPQAA